MQIDVQAYYSGSPADLLKVSNTRLASASTTSRALTHRARSPSWRRGVGPHRIWYVGGRYAYVSIHYPEFTDQVLAIVDMAERPGPRSSASGGFLACGRAAARRELAKGDASTAPRLVAGNLAYGAGATAGSLCSMSASDRPSYSPPQPRPPFGAAHIRRCRSRSQPAGARRRGQFLPIAAWAPPHLLLTCASRRIP